MSVCPFDMRKIRVYFSRSTMDRRNTPYILFLVLFALSNAQGRDGPYGKIEKTDRPNLDLSGMPITATSSEDCQSQCYKRPDCESWAFDSCGTKCWLKSGKPATNDIDCRESGVITVSRSSLNGTLSSPFKIGSGTYPRMLQLKNGTVLSCTSRNVNGKPQISVFARVGKVFQEISQPVVGGVNRPDNCFMHQTNSGRILLAFRNHDYVNDAATIFRITIVSSEDNGNSWRFLSEPYVATSSSTNGMGVWEPFLRTSHDGSIQLFYSREYAPNDQNTILQVSRDQGVTWTEGKIVGGGDVIARDGMVGVADYNEALIMIFETNEGGHFRVKSLFSKDDGNTWTDRRDVYMPKKFNAGAPSIVTVPGKGMVAVFMTDEDALKENWVADASVKVLVSTKSNGGFPIWAGLKTVSASGFWPGAALINGKANIMYEKGNSFGVIVS